MSKDGYEKRNERYNSLIHIRMIYNTAKCNANSQKCVQKFSILLLKILKSGTKAKGTAQICIIYKRNKAHLPAGFVYVKR